MKIGIAITTFNRAGCLLEQIKLIQKFSICEYELIVCDDGSTDHTIEMLKKENINYITGKNRGIAWNKNRGIYYLANYTNSDVFLLMDDDIYPTMYGWDMEWGKAAQLHGHINFIFPELKKQLIYGDCNASNPGLCPLLTGQCIAIGREVFPLIGYMDNRFGKYGHEHTDYTNRYIKSGFGGIVRYDGTIAYAVMESGLKLISMPTSGTEEDIRKNGILLDQLRNAPIFRYPWFTKEEQTDFLKDFQNKSKIVPMREWDVVKEFDINFYLTTYPDVRNAGIHPIIHYILYGKNENRKMKPD